jgi:hypothetical protein
MFVFSSMGVVVRASLVVAGLLTMLTACTSAPTPAPTPAPKTEAKPTAATTVPRRPRRRVLADH